LDFSRLKQGEIIAGLGGIALFIFLFLDWFGAGDAGISGWDSLGDPSGLIVFLAAVVAVKLAGLAAMGRRLNIGLQRGVITTTIGWLAVVTIIWRIFATPEGADIKFGLILGLAAALAITLGAYMALRENGFEPVVATAGGRTKPAPATSSASAPAATPRRATSAPAKPRATSARSTSSKRKSSSTRSKSSGSRSRSTSTRKRSSGSRKK
jgi:hypothetical protein